MPDYTVKTDAVFEFTEKKSVFIGSVFFTPDEASAKAALDSVRSANAQAAHNVFAYSLRKNGIQRCSDDGEPQGTAGAPVLKVITLNGLTDICVVVTRYFGGILLGANGLVRAYTRAAAGAVEKAGRAEIVRIIGFTVECGYDLLDSVTRTLDKSGVAIRDKAFTEKALLSCEIEERLYEGLKSELDSRYYTNISVCDGEAYLSRK